MSIQISDEKEMAPLELDLDQIEIGMQSITPTLTPRMNDTNFESQMFESNTYNRQINRCIYKQENEKDQQTSVPAFSLEDFRKELRKREIITNTSMQVDPKPLMVDMEVQVEKEADTEEEANAMSPVRQIIYNLVNNKYFGGFIMFCIVANTAVMTLDY